MKTALVTGSRGFLGRHFVQQLWSGGDYNILECDVRTGLDCRDVFADDVTRFDLVVHCAAAVGGRAKIDGAPLDLSVNFELDAAYARWLVKTKPTRAVYLSSSAVYPTYLQNDAFRWREGWLQETDVAEFGNRVIGQPDQVYGWSKLIGEMLMRRVLYAGVDVTVVRPFSGYGSDQDDTYPFPTFVRRALNREDPFTIWGDGTQVRDFVHVDDVVGATLAAVRATLSGPLNVCTGVATSFNQLAQLVCSYAGYEDPPELQHMLQAPTGVRHRVGDPTRMLKIYAPTVTLDEGVRRALKEMKDD